MTTDHRHNESQSDRPCLAIASVTIYCTAPLRCEVACFDGQDAERRADAFLHELCMGLPLDGGHQSFEVEAVFQGGARRCSTVHRLRHGDTDGGVRRRIRRGIEFRLQHPGCRSPGETRESLQAFMQDVGGEVEPYTFRALRDVAGAPHEPDLILEHGVQVGRAEHHAALIHALNEGVPADEAVRRAYVVARSLAPCRNFRGELWDYAVGVGIAHQECHRILDRRKPLDERWPDA